MPGPNDLANDKVGKVPDPKAGDDKGKAASPPAFDTKALSDAVSGAVAKSMGPLLEGFNKLTEQLGKQAVPAPKGKGEPAVDEKEPDWDRLTNGEMVRELSTRVRKDMEGLAVAIAERLEQGQTSNEEVKAMQEISRLASRYPDFADFKEEMKSEIKGNESLTLEQAYKLAKVNNPDRVAELAKKAKDKADKDDDEGASDEVPRSRVRGKQQFGGLLPTSGKARANTRMKALDAAETAWKELGMDSWGTGN